MSAHAMTDDDLDYSYRGPGYGRAFAGGIAGAGFGMLVYALVHGLVLSASGYEYAMLMGLGGVGIGVCARVGAGYSGLIPAMLGGLFTYLAVALGTGGSLMLQFWGEGDVFGAVIAVPMTLIGLLPFQLIEGDLLGLMFLLVAVGAGFVSALVEPQPDYDRY